MVAGVLLVGVWAEAGDVDNVGARGVNNIGAGIEGGADVRLGAGVGVGAGVDVEAGVDVGADVFVVIRVGTRRRSRPL